MDNERGLKELGRRRRRAAQLLASGMPQAEVARDMHLHHFDIRGQEYGLNREGGLFFDTDAR